VESIKKLDRGFSLWLQIFISEKIISFLLNPIPFLLFFQICFISLNLWYGEIKNFDIRNEIMEKVTHKRDMENLKNIYSEMEESQAKNDRSMEEENKESEIFKLSKNLSLSVEAETDLKMNRESSIIGLKNQFSPEHTGAKHISKLPSSEVNKINCFRRNTKIIINLSWYLYRSKPIFNPFRNMLFLLFSILGLSQKTSIKLFVFFAGTLFLTLSYITAACMFLHFSNLLREPKVIHILINTNNLNRIWLK
jgi:hypothetical protein